jgi:hypothetical protein
MPQDIKVPLPFRGYRFCYRVRTSKGELRMQGGVRYPARDGTALQGRCFRDVLHRRLFMPDAGHARIGLQPSPLLAHGLSGLGNGVCGHQDRLLPRSSKHLVAAATSGLHSHRRRRHIVCDRARRRVHCAARKDGRYCCRDSEWQRSGRHRILRLGKEHAFLAAIAKPVSEALLQAKGMIDVPSVTTGGTPRNGPIPQPGQWLALPLRLCGSRLDAAMARVPRPDAEGPRLYVEPWAF